GAEVIATASGAATELMTSLGATQVVDYRTQHFETLVRDVDLVLNTIGGATQEASWATLRRDGLLVATAAAPHAN
ncbi:MAG: zinc-binding dehydrogenase, partial [Thiohalocapsa sp.]